MHAYSDHPCIATVTLKSYNTMAWGAPRGIADLVARVGHNDASLQSLCLMRGRQFDDAAASQLCEALAANTVLRELSISSHAVGPAAAAAFARMLAANTSLRSLDLGNSSFGDEVRLCWAELWYESASQNAATACTGLPACLPAPQLLFPLPCVVRLQGLAALAPGIAASASLRQLNLERKGITAAGCAAMAAALLAGNGSSCPAVGGGIEELLLGHDSIGGEGLAAVLEGFSSRRKSGAGSLRSLDLSGCGLEGSAGAAALAAALQPGGGLHGLLTLRLDGNEVGPSGVAALAPALGSAASLQQLHLQSCSLGSDGAAALAAALPADLTVLDLSGNELGSPGAAALAAALAAGAAPRLSKLLLCGSGLEDGGIAALAEGLAGRRGLALDLSGNAAGAGALTGLLAAPLVSLCLHDCRLGGSGSGGKDAAAALAEQLAAPGACAQLKELDISANGLQAAELLPLLAALAGGEGENAGGTEGPAWPCPCLRLLVVAANPGAADEEVSAAIERLQEARPALDVVRRAADSGESGMPPRA